ncbi:MAG: hypothetical protein ACOYLQ_15375 [Hyphomicrobiaceae bacterium]
MLKPMSEAPADRPILVWDDATKRYRACERMTSMEDGDVAWVYARQLSAHSVDGQAIAFFVRKPGGWVELPAEPNQQ